MADSESSLKRRIEDLMKIVAEYPRLYGLPEDEQEKRRKALISRVVTWGKKNPDLMEYLIDLGVSENGWSGYRFLLEAIGPIGNPSVVPRIVKELKLHAKAKSDSPNGCVLFKTLIELNTEDGYAAVDRILKKLKWGILVLDFLLALKDVPNPRYLSLLVRIIERTGEEVYPQDILARMAETDLGSIARLLDNKSDKVRAVTVLALQKVPKESLSSQIQSQLRKVVDDGRERLITRIMAARVLESLGLSVPPEFRKPKLRNASEDLSRLVRGVLFTESRDEVWALTEVVGKTYQEDHIRLELTYSLGLLHADLAFWTGCFWDHYMMGIQFMKQHRKNSYRLRFTCRATVWDTDQIEIERIITDLDDIILANVRRLITSFGKEYQQTIQRVNHSIATGEPILAFGGAYFWKIDAEKIRREGGCK